MAMSLSSTFTGRVVSVNEKGLKLEGHDERKREEARVRAARQRARLGKEAVAAYNQEYRRKNAEPLKAKQREYRQKNQERHRAAVRSWQIEHADRRRAYMQEYYGENRARLLAQSAQYKRANPDAVRAWNARRAALKRSAPINDLTRQQWAALKRAYHQRCAYCGLHTNALTMDHVTPLIQRGSHTARNIVPACAPCNFRKNRYAPLPVSVLPLWSDLAPAIWSQS
jgi:hypothetical protein